MRSPCAVMPDRPSINPFAAGPPRRNGVAAGAAAVPARRPQIVECRPREAGARVARYTFGPDLAAGRYDLVLTVRDAAPGAALRLRLGDRPLGTLALDGPGTWLGERNAVLPDLSVPRAGRDVLRVDVLGHVERVTAAKFLPRHGAADPLPADLPDDLFATDELDDLADDDGDDVPIDAAGAPGEPGELDGRTPHGWGVDGQIFEAEVEVEPGVFELAVTAAAASDRVVLRVLLGEELLARVPLARTGRYDQYERNVARGLHVRHAGRTDLRLEIAGDACDIREVDFDRVGPLPTAAEDVVDDVAEPEVPAVPAASGPADEFVGNFAEARGDDPVIDVAVEPAVVPGPFSASPNLIAAVPSPFRPLGVNARGRADSLRGAASGDGVRSVARALAYADAWLASGPIVPTKPADTAIDDAPDPVAKTPFGPVGPARDVPEHLPDWLDPAPAGPELHAADPDAHDVEPPADTEAEREAEERAAAQRRAVAEREAEERRAETKRQAEAEAREAEQRRAEAERQAAAEREAEQRRAEAERQADAAERAAEQHRAEAERRAAAAAARKAAEREAAAARQPVALPTRAAFGAGGANGWRHGLLPIGGDGRAGGDLVPMARQGDGHVSAAASADARQIVARAMPRVAFAPAAALALDQLGTLRVTGRVTLAWGHRRSPRLANPAVLADAALVLRRTDGSTHDLWRPGPQKKPTPHWQADTLALALDVSADVAAGDELRLILAVSGADAPEHHVSLSDDLALRLKPAP